LYIDKDRIADSERDSEFTHELTVWKNKCNVLELRVTELEALWKRWETECGEWRSKHGSLFSSVTEWETKCT